MKNLIKSLICMMFCFSTVLNAQTSDKEKYVYCELVGTQKLLTNKVVVSIDLGQKVKLFSGKNRRMVDENNKPLEFNSMVDAMNYMGQKGWFFVQAYTVTVGQANVYHWLLQRDISSFSEEEQVAILSDIKLNE